MEGDEDAVTSQARLLPPIDMHCQAGSIFPGNRTRGEKGMIRTPRHSFARLA
ncbi:MAG: hypothetical protein QOJ75_358, partial [Chloroflexota bacterium]|nr:hypothetical protein [Chloroflexota bacterium]